MKSYLALLALLAPALGFAQERAQPAESPQAFRCRVEHTPEVRQCVQKCEASYQSPSVADQRWECVQSCTVRGLWAIADCRRTALQQARQAASRATAQSGAGSQGLEQAQASR